VVDHRLEARLEQPLEDGGVGLLARVVEGVLALCPALGSGGSDWAEYSYAIDG
jgi:hypothetical protein